MLSVGINAQSAPEGPGGHEGCKDGKKKCCRMVSPEDRAGKLMAKFNLGEEKRAALVKYFSDMDAARQKEMAEHAKAMEKARAKKAKAMEKNDQKLGKIIGADNLKVLQQERIERMEARQQRHAKPGMKPGMGQEHKDCPHHGHGAPDATSGATKSAE